jgi:hypothetical protein
MHAPESFVFMFKDSDWFSKVFLGALVLTLSWTGVGLVLAAGYMVLVIQGIMRGDAILPEWKIWRLALLKGTMLMAASVVVLSPFIAASFLVEKAWMRFACLAAIMILLPFLFRVSAEGKPLRLFFQRGTLLFAARNIHYAVAANAVVLASICLGWISLVIGWPIVVFGSLLTSSSLIARMH